MKKLLFLLLLMPFFASGQLNISVGVAKADSMYLKKTPPWATTDTSVYKALYRNSSNGKFYWRGLSASASDTGKVSTSGDNMYGNYYMSGSLNLGSSLSLHKLASIGTSTTNLNMFNFVNGDMNKLRTTVAMATDTSSFSLRTNTLGQMILRLVSQTGGNNLISDSLGRFGINMGTTNLLSRFQVSDFNTHPIITIKRTGTDLGSSTICGIINFNGNVAMGIDFSVASIEAGSSAYNNGRGYISLNVRTLSGPPTSALYATYAVSNSSTPNIGLNGITTPTFQLSLNNNIATIMAPERITSPLVSGVNLYIGAGSCQATTASNMNAGTFFIGPTYSSSGSGSNVQITKGTGITSTIINRADIGAAATVDNVSASAFIVPSASKVTYGSEDTLFSITVPSSISGGVIINWTISSMKTDSCQSVSGTTYLDFGKRTAGAITAEIKTFSGSSNDNPVTIVTDLAGTIGVASTVSNTKLAVFMTVTHGLGIGTATDPTTKIMYTITNNSLCTINLR